MRAHFKSALCVVGSTVLIGAASPSLPAKQSFVIGLTGEAETNVVEPLGGTGDPDGAGVVRLSIDESKRQVCYRFDISGVATPLMAHIHRGHPLQNGPSVVTLFTGLGGKMSDCVLWTNKQLSAIVADPANYYVNLYTTEFPDGAIRGQLTG